MSELKCIGCGGDLRRQREHPGALCCAACARRYPLIGDRIPLLVEDPQAHLARLYLQHTHYLRRQREHVESLKRRACETPTRAESLLAIARALDANAGLVDRAKRELLPLLSVEDVVGALQAPDFIGYANTFEYLERDWCGIPECEQECGIIVGELHEALRTLGPVGGPVLVLGAGAGRVAWELRRRFDRVIAIDASVTMAQHFEAVLDGELSFYSIATSSIMSDDQMVTQRVATAPRDREGRDRVQYVVAHASRVPLATHSVAAVVSVYFTDVVPLHQYIGELVRVLRPGGRFVHFGPLEYHFNDLSEHLSAAEIRRTFAAAGFETAHERQVASEHLARPGSMVRRTFENWSFAATKVDRTQEALAPTLNPGAKPAVARQVAYRVLGEFTDGGHVRREVELQIGSSGCFRTSPLVVDILELCDAGATVSEIVERLCSVDHEVTADDVRSVIEKLLWNGALAV